VSKVDTHLNDELAKLAKPLQDWLVSNFDPHCKIEVDHDGAYVLGGLIGAPMSVDVD
jgi:hypothetical protein